MWTFPAYHIETGLNWDYLDTHFQWYRDMKTVQQDPIWHEEGDVQIHTQMLITALLESSSFKALQEQDKHILITAALLHDVEKRSTSQVEKINGIERITSPRHAKKGEFSARTFLYKELPCPFHIREQICKLVRWHGLPLWAIEKTDPRKAVIEASLLVNTEHLYLLAQADLNGRICHDKTEMQLRADLFKELCLEHHCFGQAKIFKSDYGRFQYLNKKECAPDYHPYDDRKSKVTLLAGLPGAGKDSYINKHFDLPVLSLDNIRRTHGIAPTDKRKNGMVIQLAKEQAKEWLRKRQHFVLNATNVTSDMRGKWLALFHEYGAATKVIYLEVPYATLIRQNKNREYSVPQKAVEKLLYKLEIPRHKEAHELQFEAKN